ncbi:Torso-like protein, partial [Operophtera brumata]
MFSSQSSPEQAEDYEDDNNEPIVPFSEKNIRVFVNVTSKSSVRDGITDMDVQLCETFDDLLNAYFKNFIIEGEKTVKMDNLEESRVAVKGYVTRAIEELNVTDTADVFKYKRSGYNMLRSYIRYLYSRPSLLRLHYNPPLVHKLDSLLDDGALLGLALRTLRPMFRDTSKGAKYSEL